MKIVNTKLLKLVDVFCEAPNKKLSIYSTFSLAESMTFSFNLFSVDEENYGTTASYELKPNGSKISVKNYNKYEYIRLVIERKFVSRVRPQVKQFVSQLQHQDE